MLSGQVAERDAERSPQSHASLVMSVVYNGRNLVLTISDAKYDDYNDLINFHY